MSAVRVVVVDDSPTMRAIIRMVLLRDGDIEVVGEAGDPFEAREIVRALSPDVITLDVNMPRMSGLEFLEKVMRLKPTPVIMVSSEVGEGAAASVEALACGAFDCMAKPQAGHAMEAFAELPAKVRAAARAPVSRLGNGVRHRAGGGSYRPDGRVLAIGASTGGVDALTSILSAFPANCPPTVITQHMPASFTASFAARLNRTCAPEVAEASEGVRLETGKVYLAPGGAVHLEVTPGLKPACRLEGGAVVSGHRPSVDVLFRSVSLLGSGAVGVILTGMGRDGAAGLLAMRRAGALTLGQDPGSSLVYGMPRAAFEGGGVSRQLPLEEIPGAVLAACGCGAVARAG